MKSILRAAPALIGVLCTILMSGCSGSDSAPGNPFSGKGEGGGEASKNQTWISDRFEKSDGQHRQIIVDQSGDSFQARIVKARYGLITYNSSFSQTTEDLPLGYRIYKDSDGKMTITGLSEELTDQIAVKLHKVEEHSWWPADKGAFSQYKVTYDGQSKTKESFVRITSERATWNSYVWQALVYSRDMKTIAWLSDEPWPNSGFDESSTKHREKLSNCTTKEVIQVPAGYFNTCRVDEGDGLTVWYSNVRTGVVRVEFQPNLEAKNPNKRIPGFPSTELIRGQTWELQFFGH